MAIFGIAVAILSAVPNQESTIHVTTAQSPRPVQDEWGIYDPEQAGFEAVLRRLSIHDDEAETASPSAQAGSR